ncbi:MAG: phosphoribosylformylglycinamidine synthase subunit PurL, partial [Candidatus Omnitrophica bacterium]|nr:phosphoribosylformylglycinamidine synthase subunit PurL [Candidatus Omnitrophota bacterium]
RDLITQIKDLGIEKNVKVFCKKVYFIEGPSLKGDIETIASSLLIDPVTEKYLLSEGLFNKKPSSSEIIITYNPGVSDPVTLSLEKAIKDLSCPVKNTRIARLYRFENLTQSEIEEVSQRLLYNPLIEHVLDYEKTNTIESLDEFSASTYKFKLENVDISCANEEDLKNISSDGCLSLNLEEMKIIKDYFKKNKRNPTDCELETIATLWSEHCAHKTFRGIIEYEEKDASLKTIKKSTIDNLLKTTVMKATNEIKSSNCVSVFHDNSGVVKFDKDFNICFKVETHNHPSSLEPYGGASTGIGGVIRDILGTGLAAKPFASIDVFCFSPWHIKYDDLPLGLLHPKRVMKGVIRGVRDYGNRMGIPTVAGAVLFDERFLGNPLVYCGTLGLIPKNKCFKKVHKGDLVFVCGAKTGRDGIHGATFSSKELDEKTVFLTSAVQIGNAIEEKKMTEAILRARDLDLFNAITDCGAGGLCSAVTELAQGHGVSVNLEKVPHKYNGLNYTEIWISESQERMVFFAKKENLEELTQIFKEEDVDLTVIGKVTDTKRLELSYENNKVCELDMDFIFNLPRLTKKATWIMEREDATSVGEKENYNEEVKMLLSCPGIACKDWILREYDHEVQAGSVLKSIYGIENLSVSDAAVIRPDLKTNKAVSVGLGINPFYSDIDPYWMAALAIDEALRNVVCVGGNLKNTYILDNFCWGSPEDERNLAGLVRASFSAYDFSKYFEVPFISGKDSLYNEYAVEGKRISIPGTLLISAVSVIDDWQAVITANLKKEGNLIYLIGLSKPEMAASEYFRKLKVKGGFVPKVDKETAKKVFEAVSYAINKKLAVACHDLSEGGLAVAVSEMCMGANLGANIFLNEVPKEKDMASYEVLFGESPTRFLVEVPQEKRDIFEKEFKGLAYGLIGCVSKEPKLVIYANETDIVINLKLDELRDSWLKTFKEFR